MFLKEYVQSNSLLCFCIKVVSHKDISFRMLLLIIIYLQRQGEPALKTCGFENLKTNMRYNLLARMQTKMILIFFFLLFQENLLLVSLGKFDAIGLWSQCSAAASSWQTPAPFYCFHLEKHQKGSFHSSWHFALCIQMLPRCPSCSLNSF